jgi:hypothetical protein
VRFTVKPVGEPDAGDRHVRFDDAKRSSLPELRAHWQTIADSWFALADELDRLRARTIRLVVDNDGEPSESQRPSAAIVREGDGPRG